MASIEQLLRAQPSCLSGFQATPNPEPTRHLERLAKGYAAPTSAFGLACRCGCDTAFVLGHWVGQVFVSPLHFECTACGATTQIFDSAVHGYDASVAPPDSNLRGTGDPERFQKQPCRVVAFFTYQFDPLEEVLELSEESGVPPQDLFDTFSLYCVPQDSSKLVGVADFELA